MSKDEKYWFESIGYGSEPIRAWRTWGLIAASTLTSAAAALLVAERSPVGLVAIVISAAVLFLALGVRRLRGGWRPLTSGDIETKGEGK